MSMRVAIPDEVGDLLGGLARVAAGGQEGDLKRIAERVRRVQLEGGISQGELIQLVDVVQSATAKSIRGDDELEPVRHRVGVLSHLLVMAADPTGRYREQAIPAIKTLSESASAGGMIGALEALIDVGNQLRADTPPPSAAGDSARADALTGLARDTLGFLAEAFSQELPELLEGMPRIRQELERDAGAVGQIGREVEAYLQRLRAAVGPVKEQKSVIKGLLDSFAEQLAAANEGSAGFVEEAARIRAKLEAAKGVEDLEALQAALIEATVSASAKATAMQDQLGDLGQQVSSSQAKIDELERALSESRAVMNLDPLTQVPNRRAMDQWVDATLYSGKDLLRSYAVLVIDLDHFKKVNDTLGHLAGDAVLAAVARRLKVGIREVDFLARYGGEEFVLILPDCPLNLAGAVATRICQLVRHKPIRHEQDRVTQTASIGVAVVRPGEAFKHVFERADQCVYVAKESGRNQAVREDHAEAS